MKDAGFWVIAAVILVALFNKDCHCTNYIADYLDQPRPWPDGSHEAR